MPALETDSVVSSFSSRGPVTVDGSDRMKPNVSAPGESIRSSTLDGWYDGGFSGTSMATPHVAGLAALVLSRNPSLTPAEVRTHPDRNRLLRALGDGKHSDPDRRLPEAAPVHLRD